MFPYTLILIYCALTVLAKVILFNVPTPGVVKKQSTDTVEFVCVELSSKPAACATFKVLV